MPVVISMLRGVNVGGHNLIKMDALRSCCESLGFSNVQTYVQSGNIVFRAKEKSLKKLVVLVETAIEKKFGFRPRAILRTSSEMKSVIARNPFAKRSGIHSSKLLITFFAEEPNSETKKKLSEIKADPEEMYLDGRELYVYFPNGMGRPKLN